MTRRKWGRLLTWLVLTLLAVALFCVYKSIGLGVTSEEGLRSSIPGMKSDAHYSPEDVRKEEKAFREMALSANRWMEVAGLALLTSIASGVAAYTLSRSRTLTPQV